MHPVLIVLATVFGTGTGLLVPRAAYRLAVEPGEARRTACPQGGHLDGLAGGWIGFAKGYGPGWRSVPLLTALVCAALAAVTGPRPELAVWLLLTPVAMLLATVDVTVHRLPDVVTLPVAGAVLALLGIVALLPAHCGSWTGALLGAVALAGLYLVLFVIHPSGMGFGDVKLALTVGAALGWYGWTVLFLGAVAGFVLGSLYGLVLIVLRRAGRKSALPFGPFMLLGALAGVLVGGAAC